MDVTVTDSGPCRKTLAIVVPPAEVKNHVSRAYSTAAKQVQIKGFRQGKVPRAVLEKRFGSEILSEAKMQLLNQSYQDALREHDLTPLGEPDVEGIDDGALDEGQPLQFTVHIDVRPEFEIGEVKGIEVRRGEEDVTDEDVENALAQLAAEKRTLKPVEGAVEDGDFVKMDLLYKNAAGEPVHERKEARLNTNIPIAGTDAQAFQERLRGAEQGQQLEVEIEFPDSFEVEAVRGEKGTVDMTLQEVLRVTPAPIDDTLAEAYDFETLDALKTDLRERLGIEKKRSNRHRQEEDVFTTLIQTNPFDLPGQMVEDQAKHALAQFKKRMEDAKLPAEEIEQRVEQAQDEAREDAERRVRLFFLLGKVAEKHKIFVTETDVDVELKRIAADNNVSVDQVRDHYESHKMLPDLRQALREAKVRDFLRENATLTD